LTRCGCASKRPNRVAIGLAGLRNCTDRPDSREREVVEDEGDDDRQRDGHYYETNCYDRLDDRFNIIG
jgi:hypothetical protein